MRAPKFVAATLTLTLVLFGCGGDDTESVDETGLDGTTTSAALMNDRDFTVETTTPTSSTPTLPSTSVPSAVVDVVVEDASEDVEVPRENITAPFAPSNPRCIGGGSDSELLVEFDAPVDETAVSLVRVYAAPAGQRPLLLNGEYAVSQIDTEGDNGTRWTAVVTGLASGVAYDLAVTSFNVLSEESGWYVITGSYAGAGVPCPTEASQAPTEPEEELPPTVCSVGCEEEEGSAASDGDAG